MCECDLRAWRATNHAPSPQRYGSGRSLYFLRGVLGRRTCDITVPQGFLGICTCDITVPQGVLGIRTCDTTVPQGFWVDVPVIQPFLRGSG
ncbi:hypothetical protein J6590_055539 [Homalodisca vitripennis]|nr:hypothetical protein J6590_055539 [Homalodisca vitripennis]